MRVILVLLLVLGGCARLGLQPPAPEPAQPDPPPSASPVTASGATAEALDTTTEAERAAAVAPAAGGTLLGTTVASLGNPAEQGIWLETPLVSAAQPGRVALPGGASVQVELRPIPGEATAGSRLSLAAMRLLGVALTDLPEIEVYGG